MPNETQVLPCPTCGEPLIDGYMHQECNGIKPNAMIKEIPGFGSVISFGPGASMNDVLNFISGKKDIYCHAEQFDWTSTDGKMSIALNVTELNASIARAEVDFKCVVSALDIGLLQNIIETRSTNPAHVFNMPEARMNEPIIFIEAENGKDEYILADGRHRYLCKMIHVIDEVTCYLIPFKEWQRFGRVTMNQRSSA